MAVTLKEAEDINWLGMMAQSRGGRGRHSEDEGAEAESGLLGREAHTLLPLYEAAATEQARASGHCAICGGFCLNHLC